MSRKLWEANEPFFNDVIQLVHRLVIFKTFRATPFPSSKRTSQLFGKGLVFSEFSEDGFVGKVCDVLCIVE